MARDIAQEILDGVRSGKPDYVIASLIQEREDKISSQGLAGKVPTTSTILSMVGRGVSSFSGGGGGAPAPSNPAPSNPAPTPVPTVNPAVFGNSAAQGGTPQPTATVTGVSSTGIAGVAVDGYSPIDYLSYSSGVNSDPYMGASGGAISSGAYGGGSAPGVSGVIGAVILGLVGIALLDRFMNK